MTLLDPLWLLLCAPVMLAWWRFRARRRVLAAIRLGVYAALVLAICGPRIVMRRPGGTIIVVADRSQSMPVNAAATQREAIGLLRGGMRAGDQLRVVGFGVDPTVEAEGSDLFTLTIDDSASNLGRAIAKASSLVEEGRPARLLVLSDGRATDGSGPAEAARAASRKLAIDYRWMGRSAGSDLAIDDLIAPASVGRGESFLIHASVHAPTIETIQYELRRGDHLVSRGSAQASPEGVRLSFRDSSDGEGSLDYVLSVSGAADDPVPENNRARLLIGTRESSRLLVVSATPDDGLARLLASSGIEVDRRGPGEVDGSLEALARYDAVIIENSPIQDLGLNAAENIALLVRERGLGLMMTGGRRSFAAGGYFESPLDKVLPVSMELRSEFRKTRVAVVVAMDRSGSMAAPVAGGRTKMELAGSAAARVLELLTPFDMFGAIAIDSVAHTIVEIGPAGEAMGDATRLRRLDAGGGGIYVYVALRAAAKMVLDADAGTRHIILFADAADSEEPGAYRELLGELRAAGVTVSVVGLGTPHDVDAELLRDIAALGGGREFFTNDAQLLPELFTQDVVAVARGAIIDSPTPLRATADLSALLERNPGPLPTAGGYNPLFLKPGATQGIQTVDEYAAPFLSFWNVGLGRSIAHAGEANGGLTGELAQWPGYGALWTGLAHVLAGQRSRLGPSMVARQSVREGVARIELYVDSEAVGGLAPPLVRLVRRASSGATTVEQIVMQFDAPDRLVAEVPMHGEDVIVPTIDLGDGRREPLAPATLPYSPEFRPSDELAGRRLLALLAQRTGGRERGELTSIWSDLPESISLFALQSWLFSLAIVLLVLEVAERRVGVLVGVWSLGRSSHRSNKAIASSAAARSPSKERRERPTVTDPPTPRQASVLPEQRPVAPPSPAAAGDESRGSVVDAMRSLHRRK